MPGTAALGTGSYPFPAGTVTVVTGLQSVVFDFDFPAEDGLVEIDTNIMPEITAPGSSTGTPASAPAASSTEEGIENAGEISEYILESAEGVGVECGAAHVVHTGKPELIVSLTLLIIREYLVGFGCLFELGLSVGIILIAVRVILHREFAVSFFDIIGPGTFFDA